jgi:hypothetical protein
VPVVDRHEGIDAFGCDRSNRPGPGSFVAVRPEGSGVKRSTKSKIVVEGWRLIATIDELKLRAPVQRVKQTYSSPVELGRDWERPAPMAHAK